MHPHAHPKRHIHFLDSHSVFKLTQTEKLWEQNHSELSHPWALAESPDPTLVDSISDQTAES